MAKVFNYVDVQITRQIEAITRVGFGTLLFIGETDDGEGDPKQGGKVVEYSNFDAVAAVFDPADPEYQAAQAYFGQEMTPERLFVGFKGDAEGYDDAIDEIAADNNEWYAVAIESKVESDILAVAANIQARDKIFLAHSDDSGIPDPDEEGDVASQLMDNSYNRTGLLYHSQHSELCTEAVVTVDEAEDGFEYRISIEDPDTGDIADYTYVATETDAVGDIATELATLVDEDELVSATADGADVTVTAADVSEPFKVSISKKMSVSRTFPDIYPQCAWAGLMLPKDPGAATWAYKTLSGVPVDKLNTTERNAIAGKRASYYVMTAGNAHTFEGAVSELGLFLDIIRATDWIRFRLAEDIFARLTSVDKIPYIGGDAVIEQLIRARLDIAVDREVIADDYTVTVPPAAEQTASDRADRVYSEVKFEATLAGAIHKVKVRGVLTV